MKLAKVKYEYSDDVVEGYIVTAEDLPILKSNNEKAIDRVLSTTISSNIPINKIDHIIGSLNKSDQGLARHALTRAFVTEQNSNPLYHLDSASDAMISTVSAIIESFGSAFINSKGGCRPASGLEIVDQVDVVQMYNVNDFINLYKGSRVLNLENDPQLESEAVDFMEKNFKSFSYITCLRYLTEDQLKSAFKDFKNYGGDIIYVYTTGIDTEQIRMYIKNAIDCGLIEFRFQFKGDVTEEIEATLNEFQNLANIKILS